MIFPRAIQSNMFIPFSLGGPVSQYLVGQGLKGEVILLHGVNHLYLSLSNCKAALSGTWRQLGALTLAKAYILTWQVGQHSVLSKNIIIYDCWRKRVRE